MKLIRGFDNLDAVTAAGAPLVANRAGANKGLTLVAGTTYYVPLTGSEGALSDLVNLCISLMWAAAPIITAATIETCNFPAFERGENDGPADVTDFDATGNWVQFNPGQAGDLYGNVFAGAGNAIAAFTVSSTGAAAGGAALHIPHLAARRARVKIVVGATGGLVRVGWHAKPVMR